MKVQEVAGVVVNASLLLAGVGLLGFGLKAAYDNNSAMTGVCIAGAILLMFAGTIDRFESIKGLGVEAKTKRLDEKLNQADVAIEQLRQLAETLGAASVDAQSKLGRLSSPTADESYSYAQSVRSVMVNLGSKPEAIRAMLQPFIHTMLFDLTAAILWPVHKNLGQNLQDSRNYSGETLEEMDQKKAIANEALKFQNEMVSELWGLPVDQYPNEVLKRVASVPLLDSDVREAAQKEILAFAADMLLLRADGTLANPAGWFAKIATYRSRYAKP